MAEPKWDTSPEGILSLISNGEGEHVEFKVRMPPDAVLARTITAFANATGGVLLIGLSDDGGITGLMESEANIALHRLESIGRSFPGLPYRTGITHIDGKAIVYMEIGQQSKELRPLATADGRFYQRTGDRDVDIGKEDIWQNWIGKLNLRHPKPDRVLIAFVAMSLRNEEEPHLVDYYRAMERAAKRTGSITLTRIDLVEGDYEISQKIMDQIDTADLIICDFTLNPRNVYFELGYARGREKAIVQTARKGTALEFDVRNWRTVFYRNATELEEFLVKAFGALKVRSAKLFTE